MKPWASAFVIRALRQDARFVSQHVLRAGLAGIILLLFLQHVATYSLRTGVGGNFAQTVMLCCYAAVTLLGGVYFSTAIVEEKEEQTLPLLRLTGASTRAILVGKSGPRLISVVLLLLVITPFLILSITLGGVLIRGLLTAMLGLLTYAVMFSQLSLFASVVSHNVQTAFSRTLVMWGLLEFLPFWAWGVSASSLHFSGHRTTANAQRFVEANNLLAFNWLEFLLGWLHVQARWLTDATEELVLFRSLPLYLADFGDGQIWQPQMTAHLVLGGIFLALSHLLFVPMTAKVVGEGFDSPGRFTRSTRPPRRVHGPALMWKSWRLLSGGWFWLIGRLVGFPLAVIGIVIVVAWGVDVTPAPEAFWGALLGAGVVLFVGHFAILLERVFTTEVQQKTLSSLLMLPVSRKSLCAQLIVGLVPAIMASLSSLVCGLVVMLATESRLQQWIDDRLMSPWLCTVFLMLASTLLFGLYLSLQLRQGGMLVAILLLWFLGPFTVGLLFSLLSVAVGSRQMIGVSETTALVALTIVQVLFCVWMYRLLIRRFNDIGASC